MFQSEKKGQQNEITSGALQESDLNQRLEEITKEVAQKTGFIPDHLLRKSGWWDETKIGAFHYSGIFKDQKVVLKVQGFKPETSEVDMISAFEKQNESKKIRPPKIFANLPWREKAGYEAIVMEDVGTNTVISFPTNEDEINKFFWYYLEYRKNCLNEPWLEKPNPNAAQMTASRFEKWKEIRAEKFLDNPFRLKEDDLLIDKAVEVLVKRYKGVDLEFIHGHFSARDLYKVKSEIVLLSNLYWSWRPPLYNSIFAYHWFMYDLAGVPGITSEKVEEQRKLWLGAINTLPEAKREDGQVLLKIALLERAAAGLNLDALSTDIDSPVAEHLVIRTREITKELIKELG